MAAATEAAERLGIVAHSDGPFVPVQTRSERFASTDHEAHPTVEAWQAEWKLTPVDRIRDLIDDKLDGSPYPIQYPDIAGTTVEWIDRADSRIGSAGIPEERASANGWSSFEKALRIGIEGEPDALTVTRAAMGEAPRAAHVLVEAAPHSKGLVVLDSRGPAALSENVEIVVGEGAQLTLVSLQEWDDDARHLASHFATIAKDAKLTHIVVSLGGAIVRVRSLPGGGRCG